MLRASVSLSPACVPYGFIPQFLLFHSLVYIKASALLGGNSKTLAITLFPLVLDVECGSTASVGQPDQERNIVAFVVLPYLLSIGVW